MVKTKLIHYSTHEDRRRRDETTHELMMGLLRREPFIMELPEEVKGAIEDALDSAYLSGRIYMMFKLEEEGRIPREV